MNSNDPIRNKLWADVFLEKTRAGKLWFQAKDDANQAVEWYDRRPPAPRAAKEWNRRATQADAPEADLTAAYMCGFADGKAKSRADAASVTNSTQD